MNKVLQINLGGYPFTIDEDAYKKLDTYIKEIRQHFAGTEGYEEITTDIEARLAELFQERLTNRPIVSLKDVEEVITRMGRPEEFETDSMGDDDPTQSKKDKKSSYKTGKRLFRNTDEQIIAGVCSGIAAYFGISDPIWVRLAFVLIALSGGFGVPIYLILWAIVPKAGSASDRLAMRGEPINVSNISRIVKEEFEHISKKVSEFSEEMSDKGKKQKFAKDLETKIDFRVHQAVDGLGDFLGKVAKALSNIWKPILFIIAIILILLMLAAWISAVFAAFVSPPVVHYFFPEHTGLASLGFISLMFVIGIPLLTTALGIFSLFSAPASVRPGGSHLGFSGC
ncbi:MAG: PspC domain-containing protein [Saprospiraceae bacterium]